MVEQVVPKPETEDVVAEAVAPPWMTILHNCDCHTFEQVVKQLQKAIACSEAEGWEIAWQVHNTGKAVVKIGPEAECVRVGNILASIGLVVTVVPSCAPARQVASDQPAWQHPVPAVAEVTIEREGRVQPEALHQLEAGAVGEAQALVR